MNVKYRVSCFDSEVLVKQADDDETAFQVNIQNTTNPLGFGNTLGSYASEQQATLKANIFCMIYTLARKNGYSLRSNSFVKPDKEDIPVSTVLDSQLPQEQLELLFQQ
ncbi:hypothetical protein EBB07_14500 [Paenibacillaceae bacterium]|nr:hypothetical protein EBB07_14500 [Paenibacillaceae bacterium]